MKDEGEPLGRIETIEDDEQCKADGVGQNGFLLRIDFFRDDLGRRQIWSLRSERFFAPRSARAEHVEADARDNGGQPPAEILDRTGVGAAETQPRFLHRIVGLARGTQHSVSDSPEVPTIFFEFFCQPILFACHISSLGFVMVVTEQTDTL